MYTHIPSSIFKTSPWPCVCTLLHVYRTPSVFVLEKVWEKVKLSCHETSPPHSKESFVLGWFQWFECLIQEKAFHSFNSFQRQVKLNTCTNQCMEILFLKHKVVISGMLFDYLMTFCLLMHTLGAIWTTLLSSCMTKRQPQMWINFRFSNSGWWCLLAPQPSGWEIANSWSSGMKAASQIPAAAAAAAQWHIGRWPLLNLSATAESAAESADKSKSSHEIWCLRQRWRQPGWVEMKNIQIQCGIQCGVGNRWREMREVPCHHGWTVCFEVTNKNVRPWTAVPLWRWQICI